MSPLRYAESDDELRRCFPAVRVLRPHLTDAAAFVAQVRRQQAQGYRLAFAEAQEGGAVACIAGFRFAEFLAWGRVLYIDDLVTTPAARGRGLAGALLDAIIELARAEGCDAVHLDSGHQRFDAHRLYLNKRFRITSHHFALDLREG